MRENKDIDFNRIFFSKSHKKSVALVVIIFLLLISFLVIYYKFSLSIISEPTTTTIPVQKTNSLCYNFTKVPDKTSCEEAIAISLEKYPGEVFYIEKKESKIFDKTLGLWLNNTEDVWLIRTNLYEQHFNPPAWKLEAMISMTGNIIYFKPLYD